MDDPFQGELNALRARSLHRRLRQMQPAPDGTVELAERGRLVNFASNDYLGLADDPILREAAKAAIDEYGVGAGASRLVSGTRPAHTRLEEKLAAFKGAEAALTFSSGYAAAWGAIGALADRHDVLILDKLVHACLVDAARASGAIVRVFPHNALGKLEDHLQWARREHPGCPRDRPHGSGVQHGRRPRAAGRTRGTQAAAWRAAAAWTRRTRSACIGRNGRGLAAELGVSRRDRHPHGHDEQGAGRQRRVSLRTAQPDRPAGQPGAFVHFFDRPAARAGGGGRGGDRFPAHRRGRTPPAGPVAKHPPARQPASAVARRPTDVDPPAARRPDGGQRDFPVDRRRRGRGGGLFRLAGEERVFRARRSATRPWRKARRGCG